jgi:signal transduction histidine kinase
LNIYSKKQHWKLFLGIAAILIVIASLWYTNKLAQNIATEERQQVKVWAEAIQRKAQIVNFTNELFKKIADEERKKVEIWAEANKRIATAELESELNFYLNILSSNTTIPVIAVNDKNEVTAFRNLEAGKEKDTAYIHQCLQEMKLKYPPIEIVIWGNKKQYLYYNDSQIFTSLKEVLDKQVKNFISELVLNSSSVPVIFTDSSQQQIIAFGNIDSNLISSKLFVKKFLEEMKAQNPPITITLADNNTNYIFYKDSKLLTRLRYYPYLLWGIIALFIIISYSLFSTARKSEQNQVWVGMSKETAHQLGTPLSSLMAWLEILGEKGVDEKTLTEMQKDLQRLETITDRFSKIGATPKLNKENITETLEICIAYLRPRISNKVSIDLHTSNKEIMALHNPSLFNWVMENLIKNAVDAMEGKGAINITITDQMQFVYIDVSDTGKGIPSNKHKTIFEPGYTTKKRGWGLGLSLTKRIIENYHNGKIFVKQSNPENGTTFRIVLKK